MKAWVESLSKDEVMALAQQINGGGLANLLGSATGPFPRNRPIELPPPPEEPRLLTFTIELRGSRPRIWRRLSLPGDLTLDAVHTLFQAAMGWSDSHLHRFQPGTGQVYSDPYFVTEFDEDEGDDGTREEGVRLDQLLRAPGDRMTYLYDFGDDWEHRVTLESSGPLTAENRQPTCLAGAKACPPEDVGGVHGHHEVARWLRAGAPVNSVPEPFEDAEHAHGWLPDGYDPDAFDIDETTDAMRLWASGQHLPWHGMPESLVDLLHKLHGEGWALAMDWLIGLGDRVAVDLSEDDVRLAARPWLAVLDAVGSGTKLTAAGYLPPILVEQIAEATGISTWWIGKVNREDQTWPVASLRENTQAVGLLRKSKGVLAPTARARAVSGYPRALVSGVLKRLPLGTGFDEEAGWFLLLGLAAGASGAELDLRVAQMLNDRGWRLNTYSPVTPSDARRGCVPTLDALESMAGDDPDSTDVAAMARLARAALLGVADVQPG